ncbi:MAG: hypothetical protein ACXW6K_19435, partial [Candidatus Binatia bacterium]
TWSSGVAAKVFRFVGSVQDSEFASASTGAQEDPELELGSTYRYELRRNSNDALLASVTVTTYDLQETLGDRVAVGVVSDPALPAQHIINLTITPGIDLVRISFETTQPTIPQITCKATDGSTNVAFALINGLQTKHTCTFGVNQPLPQDMEHTFTIVAAGHDPFNGTPKDAFATHTFRTGSRHATVIFDRIKVRKDSDKLSAGDIGFFFGVGDADTGVVRGYLVREEQDISDDDPAVDVNLEIQMQQAPRRVWVQVIGKDDDSTIFPAFPPSGLDIMMPYPVFEGPGSTYRSGNYSEYAKVTDIFDITDINQLMTFPIELATGDFVLAFTVFARIRVDAFVPAAMTIRSLDRRLPKPWANLYELGKTTMIWNPGGNHAHMVGLGAEGAIYHTQLTPERPTMRDEGWSRLSGPVKMPVKAIAGRDGGLRLFAFDGKGGVLFQKPGRAGGQAAWRKLGGHFEGPLAVAEKPDCELDVFGLGDEGVVYHISIRDAGSKRKPDDWQPIGSGVAGSLSAFALPDGSVGVFALARDGQVLHKRLRRNQWTPKGQEWQPLGKANGERLIVVRPVEEKGVGLATMAEDGALQYLAWPDYPQGEPPRRWRDGGTIDAWLQARPPRVHGTGSGILRPRAAPARANKKPKAAEKRSRGSKDKLNH